MLCLTSFGFVMSICSNRQGMNAQRVWSAVDIRQSNHPDVLQTQEVWMQLLYPPPETMFWSVYALLLVKAGRLRWLDTSRTRETNPYRKVIWTKLEHTRRAERPTIRWSDIVEHDLRTLLQIRNWKERRWRRTEKRVPFRRKRPAKRLQNLSWWLLKRKGKAIPVTGREGP
jgi:hypothetical protein